MEGGRFRGSFDGVMGQEGSVEDTGYDVPRIFEWQDKEVVGLGSGGSRGGKSGHGPPSKLAMEFGPPRGQKQ